MTAEERAAAEAKLNEMIGTINSRPGSQRQKDEMIADLRQQFAQQMRTVDVNSQQNPDFIYRGDSKAAEADLGRYRGYADLTRQRSGIYADYANANAQRANGLAARGSQQDALGLYRNAALGIGPSAAQSQLQMGVDRGIQGAMSIGNSARGGALGLAQGRLAAMGAGANGIAQSAAHATSLRNQEMQQGMAGYAGLGSQMRGQDMQGQGADAQMAQQQASLGLQSRGQNDATGLAYEGLGQGVVGQAGSLGLAREAALQHNADALTAQSNALRQQNAQTNADNRAMAGAAISLVPAAGQAVNAAANYYQANQNSQTAGGQLTNAGQGVTTGSNTQSTSSGLTAQPNDPTQGYRVRPAGTTGWSPRKYF